MADTPTSTSSNSSCNSYSSFDDISVKSNDTSVKFVCNYGGKILPHYHHGQLRYFGGDRRILSVDRSISYSELVEKLCELSGYESVTLRCKLPNEDLDALITIKSDDGLLNLIEEYDFVNKGKINTLKIKAFLYEVKSSPSCPSKYSCNRWVNHRIYSKAATSRFSNQNLRPIVHQAPQSSHHHAAKSR